ncbi:MAG: major facilitator superfamily 1 [Pseudonocardia sp.]|jgi:UMF1 family MFS transporter|uniref:MFS transporter n=1 Tax=Pseudonocardia sp. TaxID=60912 RepID=UPI002603A3AD|nr:MFS transporter [Pseudonocardia sp.]MCU1629161.1 major facilitator superfamily 1 [Pseudonocardia sp.]MDT7704302.1 transporter, family [Pseudonocardiales bacterium]HEV7469346.1 MFS transporter [Pseudonocardia sp.]
MNSQAPEKDAGTRRRIVAWGLWDWGSSGFNVIVLTFVFSVYLTDSVGKELPGPISANSWLGWAIGASGLVVALMAPVIGQSADRAGRRLRSTGLWTAACVLCLLAMIAVRADHHYLWLGLLLLGGASLFYELAVVSYNAILRQISTPETIGRVSGFGWSMGYFGGIVALLAAYVLLIANDGGLLGVSTEDGFNIRLVALLSGIWFAVFAIPLFRMVPEAPAALERPPRLGVAASYRKLFRDLRDLYRASPHTVYFLAASALYRDGLAAVFTFGGVLAVTVYGIAADDVLIFGVAANVVSAAGALAGGWLDDRRGPKIVVAGSLIGMIAAGVVLLFLSGPTAFWIFGLALCLFVGPAQSSSRTYLARLTPAGQEGQLFGLYATTGRAVSFIAPTLVGLFTYLFATDRAGMAGILLVLALGVLALWKVRAPAPALAPAA